MATTTDTSSRLCNTCRSIDWRLLFSYLEPADQPRAPIIHHESLASLLACSECDLCAAIRERFNNDEDGQIPDLIDCPVTISLGAFHNSFNPHTTSVLGTGRRQGHIHLAYRCEKEDRPNGEFSSVGAIFDLCASEDSPFANSIPGRLIHPNPLSAFKIAQGWTQECSHAHTRCRRPAPVPLPTRLLELSTSTSGIIRLCEVQRLYPGAYGHYAALSHCWGSTQAFTTTKDSLPARTSGIQLSALTQTFRDAVCIARNLGIRLLWIDSLCILQDDSDDWKRESAAMGAIYHNALIVIAASRSNSGDQGFLSMREPSDAIAIDIALDAMQGRIYIKKNARNIGALSNPLAQEPLQGRGWVLQERYLAQRTLFFGIHQMYWECQEMLAAEYGARWPRGENSISAIVSALRVPHLEAEKPYEGHLSWCKLLEVYSQTALTNEMDRLPALSGIAAFISHNNQLDYCAGIWLAGIIPGLLWRRLGFNLLNRPDSYRAPSWSWASVDGYREFTLSHIRYVGFPAETRSLTTYHSHSIPSDPANPYIPINSGYLKVSGPIFPLLSTKGNYDITHFGESVDFNPRGIAGFAWPFVYETFAVVSIDLSNEVRNVSLYIPCSFDFPGERDSLSVLFLAQRQAVDYGGYRKSHCYFGLVLRSVNTENNVYERVGIVEGILTWTSPHYDASTLLNLYKEAVDVFEDPESDGEISIRPDFALFNQGLGEYPISIVTLI